MSLFANYTHYPIDPQGPWQWHTLVVMGGFPGDWLKQGQDGRILKHGWYHQKLQILPTVLPILVKCNNDQWSKRGITPIEDWHWAWLCFARISHHGALKTDIALSTEQGVKFIVKYPSTSGHIPNWISITLSLRLEDVRPVDDMWKCIIFVNYKFVYLNFDFLLV